MKPSTTISILLALGAALALSGCASISKALANRVSCTADGSVAIVSSMYGPLGVSSIVDAQDAAAICQGPAK